MFDLIGFVDPIKALHEPAATLPSRRFNDDADYRHFIHRGVGKAHSAHQEKRQLQHAFLEKRQTGKGLVVPLRRVKVHNEPDKPQQYPDDQNWYGDDETNSEASGNRDCCLRVEGAVEESRILERSVCCGGSVHAQTAGIEGFLPRDTYRRRA